MMLVTTKIIDKYFSNAVHYQVCVLFINYFQIELRETSCIGYQANESSRFCQFSHDCDDRLFSGDPTKPSELHAGPEERVGHQEGGHLLQLHLPDRHHA